MAVVTGMSRRPDGGPFGIDFVAIFFFELICETRAELPVEAVDSAEAARGSGVVVGDLCVFWDVNDFCKIDVSVLSF